MANVISDLIVRLLSNTAGFESGMNAAQKQAKAAAKEIQGSFAELGDTLEKVLGPLGGLGGEIGSVLSGVGQTAKSLITSLGPIAGSFGTLGLGIAGVGAVAAAAGLGVIGLVVHATKAAAKLYDLSQATGVSVSTLSGLSQVAAISGLSVDQMAKGLEKMGKSAVAAANAAPGTKNAYNQLGIAVRDTSGNMRDQTAIFEDVANKFSTMKDGAEKTALAQQIFGKSGAELIPVLNRGGEEIATLVGHFQKLGAVMTEDTAAAAEKFKENMTLLGGAFTGVQNQLLTGLTPALNEFVQELVGSLEDSNSQTTQFVHGLIDLGKIVLNIFQIFGGVIAFIGEQFKYAGEQMVVLYDTGANIVARIKNLDFKGAGQALVDGLKTGFTAAELHAQDSANIIKNTFGNVMKVWDATTTPVDHSKQTQKGTGNLGAPVDTSFIDAAVAKYQGLAEAAEKASEGIGRATESAIFANAEAESQKEIDSLVAEGIKKKIQNTQQFKDALAAAIPKIQEAALFTQAFKAATEDSKGLESFIVKTNESTEALTNQSEAMGTVDRAQAANTARLTPFMRELDELVSTYEKLSAQYGLQNPEVQALGSRISVLTAEYNKAADAVNSENTALQKSKVSEEITKLNQQLFQLKQANSGNPFAQLDSEFQKMAVDLKLDADQAALLKQKFAELKAETTKGQVLGIAKEFGFDPAEMARIQTDIDYLKKNWESLGLSSEQYHLALQKLIADYDELKAKSGTAFDGARAGIASFMKDVPTLSQTMESVVKKGLDGVAQNFADMVTTGKADWKGLFDSMENMILQSSIKFLMKSLLNGIFGGLSGGNGGGGLFGGLFGGGKATGGNVDPGKAYIVGEKHPELFMPGVRGTIVPTVKTGSGGQTINQSFNITSPDADGLVRSKGQLQAAMYRGAALAHGRYRQ